ncbi:hypothetical protein [Mycolicibacterium septicum]|uniref:hypothetical protein n=1 Tax=Mycolicibacterium septicum TaxID=98668 RepID=UPI001AF2B787|nr:hypothetical protein [Mycolicibacterium septicum]QRY51769.1 hypothetical protein JVX95_31085 [Mycolicibacterium septicum]
MSDEPNKTFRLHWLHGATMDTVGPGAVTAFNRAGVGRGALAALDYFEEVAE